MFSPRRTPTRIYRAFVAILALMALDPAMAGPPGLDTPEAVGAYFNGVFPPSPPGNPTGFATENAFPNLTFVDPLCLKEIPGTNQLLVAGKTGLIHRFVNSPATTQAQRVQVLDWTQHTETSEDQGFYSLTFHPNFGQSGETGENYVYVCYSRRAIVGTDDNNRTYWTVSRFTWLPASGILDPNSEFILISQYDPHRYHNGGAAFFGDDGFFYVTNGDGGDGGDTFGNSQKIDGGLFSGILRIDVDNDPAKSHAIRRQPTEDPDWELNPRPLDWPASYSQGYGIPNDNPWLNVGGSVLEEFYAIGLRSPHSAHFDPVTDEIWVGDVGQNNREELTRVTKGLNCQWVYKEGTRELRPTPVPLIGTDNPPVYDYPHTEGQSIIAGMRYRGTKWNTFLAGKVIFGDHVRGRIWTMGFTSGGQPDVVEIVSGFDTGYKAGLANFFTDAAGEIYIMNLAGNNNPTGTIHKLAVPALAAEPPQLLSQTGVFANLATLTPAPGVIPYNLPNPLWSDGAEKQRWAILPNNGTFNSAAEDVIFSAENNWTFPAGSIFVKHFEVSIDANQPALMKRLETRFIVCIANGKKYGVTYKWNEAGTDAELLDGGLNETYTFTDSLGATEQRAWSYPSRGDCLNCHNDVSGQALGFRTYHLNSKAFYPSTGRTANQLETLNALGVFNVTLTAGQLANYIEARPLDDETAPLEHRARSYLDTNCSHCHQPGGQGAGFDARLGTPLNLQNIIDAIPERYEELGEDGRYIKPGDPSLSAIHHRMSATGNGNAMPPLAKNLAHGAGVAALESYINAMSPSEFIPPLGAGPQARYVRLTSITGKSRFAAVAEFSILDGGGVAIPAGQVTATYTKGGVPGISAAGAPPSEATDGNLGSSTNFWQSYKDAINSETPNHPHVLTFDLSSTREIGGFIYYPRTNSQDGRIYQYLVEYSTDGTNWTTFNSGTWDNVATPFTYNPGYNKRPARTHIAGPAETLHKDFDVTVVFDMDTTDFTASDLQVTGGSVNNLRGSGYYYVARISPAPGATDVSVMVPANAVNPEGKGSLASASLPVTILPDVTPPTSPANLAATPALLSVQLSWDDAIDDVSVTGYEVRRGTTLLATVTGTTYMDSGLDCDTAYHYSVTALDAAGNPSDAAEVSTATLPDQTAPSSPLNLAGIPGLFSVGLSWNASTDDIAVDAYQISRDNVVIATVQQLGYTDTGLDSDTGYDYKVTALDEAGNASSPASLTVTTLQDTVPPSSPGSLDAIPSLMAVELSWQAATDNVGVTAYRILRGELTLATISGLAYTDNGLDSDTLYQYQVIALDAEGNESVPAEVSTTTLPDTIAPSSPELLSAIPDLQSVALDWTASSDNVGVTGYRIHRNGTAIATVQGLAFNDTGLQPSTSYDYEVVALDAAGNASPAASLSVNTLADETPPGPPLELAGTPHLLSIDLTWTAASDNIAVTGYQIRRDGNLLTTIQEPGFSDSGLQLDTGYNYEVKAVDAAGNLSSPVTLAISTLADETGPSVPPNLSGTPDYHSVELAWEASTDDMGVTAYEVWRGTTLIGTVTGLAYSDTNLKDGTAYTYKVIARDAAGNVSAEAEVDVVTLGFEDWLADYGLAGETATDSDHGRLDNLMEYYLGLDPNDALDDLTFRIECTPQGATSRITFPDLVPSGDYHLHASATPEDITNPVHRVLTLTKAQIGAMTEGERIGHTVDLPASGDRGFFILIFEPPAE